MGEEKKPQKVKLFFGLLYSDEELLRQTEKRLALDFGDVDYESPAVSFDQTHYYEKEMGEGLIRKFISVKPLISPDDIAAVKLHTNRLEKLFGREDGSRAVNIDPGYLGFSKMVLATTKDYNHRIYLGRKIFAEVTLRYSGKDKSYIPWEWTYPDYREEFAIEFFNLLRSIYKKQLREET